MADRYWVGGTAAWDATAGTKWAATSGGAGGQSVPTSADNVFFDANSGAVTVTVTAAASCLDLNFTGFTGTFAGTSDVNLFGSITLVAAMTFTWSGQLRLSGTGNITSAGKSFNNHLNYAATGTSYAMQDALSITGSGVLIIQGGGGNIFTTNGYALSLLRANFSGLLMSNGTLNLGASTITLASTTGWSVTGGTVNAGTSTINFNGNGNTYPFDGGGRTYYNLNVLGTSTVNVPQIAGNNTWNNISVNAPASAGVKQLLFSAPQTINGTLSTVGTAGNRRVWLASATYGLAQTLTINSAPSLTDADFRDLYVVGTAAPISGTRIGDLRGIRGITASTPKTVYWNLAAGGNWSATAWAASSGGAVSTDNHPLAQDTAIIENTGLNTSATVTLDAAVPYIGTINMSTRTNAMTLSIGAGYTVYGDWINGSGTALLTGNTITFSGRNTQTVTSAGKAFPGPVVVDTYGGTVQLADAFTSTGGSFTVTNGTFNTLSYNLSTGNFNSNNNNVRAIELGASTFTAAGNPAIEFSSAINLTFNAGTSTINVNGGSTAFNISGQVFNNVQFSSTSVGGVITVTGAGTYNNVTFSAPATAGFRDLVLTANQTINGTLTVAGASPIRRCFVRSSVLGTTRTLTAATLSATDCDFRDITIAGAAAGSSPTRAGDCGGNTGITFPSPKTVYWNLAGVQNWSATGWAPTSGGTVDINQFPLAQDTATFDNTGAAGTVTIDQAWNIGTVDFSARTSAMTLTAGNSSVYGDWKWGTGVTSSSTGALTFRGRGTQTITSNGVQFGCNVAVDSVTGTTQLADALSLVTARTLTLTSGIFDAVTFNVTAGAFASANTNIRTLKMGSGTWTLTSTGTVWNFSSTGNLTFYKGTANIVLSDTSTSPRNFEGGSLSYNRLTIGGTTGTSTLNINSNNQFTELASTKTVAHTIALASGGQTVGRWTVTGTVGNVVTVSGTGSISIVGSRVSGVDYLALGTTVIPATSPGEFYAGANSTGGTNAILTAAPAPVTRYWVGGTGTWNATSTTNWSASSGGAGGASVPTSADAVIFDAASNATAYTVTCTATQLRCGSLTMAGPASGNVTWAGTAPLAIHGNVTLPATGLTRTYTGTITLTSNSTGLTFTTNGVTLASGITVNGVDCSWSLGSALNIGISNGVSVVNGSFNLATYNLTAAAIASDTANSRTINLGTGTATLDGSGPINLGTTETNRANLTLTASTSQLNLGSGAAYTFAGNNQTFYNVSFTNVSAHSITLSGTNSYNNLSFTGVTSAAGFKTIILAANQTVTGTLTCSAGTNATMRHFIQSDTLGTTRTITAAAVSLTDVDLRDITIAGAAAPASGTRIGDCKGNSGITFTAAVNKYWNLAAGGNWGGAIAWATSSGGAPAINNFPLAQDTAFIGNTGLNASATVTINTTYNIGTIDMSGRTTAMTLATSANIVVYGNWANGTGVTPSGTNTITFSGRASQTLTSAGRPFTHAFVINTPGGSVTLNDAFTTSRNGAAAITHTAGTFNADKYNVTLSGTTSSFDSNNSNIRTLAIGSGTWTLAGSGTVWSATTATNLTVTGTGTITLTSASIKSFSGGGIAYTNITINQGGAGQLTISSGTYKAISNTYASTGATSIAFGTAETLRVQNWIASGQAGRVLTVVGSSAAFPSTLVLTGTQNPNVDYLSVSNVRAYNLNDTWYAGANSTNGGTLGWIFQASPVSFVVVLETATGTDLIVATVTVPSVNASVLESATGSDSITARVLFRTTISESGTGTDTTSSRARFVSSVSDASTATDAVTAAAGVARSIAETASTTDAVSALRKVVGVVADTATATEVVRAFGSLRSALSDSATATDQTRGGKAVTSSITEAATGTGQASAGILFRRAVIEAVTGSDTIATTGVLNTPVVETATASDSFAVRGTFYSFVSMTVTIADTVVGRYLWEPIDDTQIPNWQTISNVQVAGWIPVKTIKDT